MFSFFSRGPLNVPQFFTHCEKTQSGIRLSIEMDNFRSNPEKISIWDLHSKIDFDEIKEIFEGEKYSKIQEKIENLRKSSDTIGLDTVGSSLDLEENTNDLVASTAPGVKFSSIEERNAHYKSDWHRYVL